MHIDVELPWDDIQLGESIALNGTCLTVESVSLNQVVRFYLSEETLDKTNSNKLKIGSLINIERSLKSNQRNSGHWVQGHIDALGRVIKAEPRSAKSESIDLHLEIPRTLICYCVNKGSIAVNGISLTINQIVEPSTLELHIVPHTWKFTNLKEITPGDHVNLEIDILAKYIERLCQPYQNQISKPDSKP